jgi:hypothetical protein
MPMLPCSSCAGEGRKYKSRYGGNDPDVWDVGQCEACEGSGHEICASRRCEEKAVAFNDDAEALCADCLDEWMTETFGS